MTAAPFLSVEEIEARWFAESSVTVRKTNLDNIRDLFTSGELAGRKIGRRWYAHITAIEAYEAGRDEPRVMQHTANRRIA